MAFNNLLASELLSLLSTETLLGLFKKSTHGEPGLLNKDGGIITAILVVHELTNRNQFERIEEDLFSIEDEELVVRLCGEAVNAKRSVGSRTSKKAIESVVPTDSRNPKVQSFLERFGGFYVDDNGNRVDNPRRENPFGVLRGLRNDPRVSKERIQTWLAKYLRDCRKPIELTDLEQHCELYRNETKEQFCEWAFNLLSRISDERDEEAI